MKSEQRRQGIHEFLKTSNDKPQSATTIAKTFNVSRQVIVNDIAFLRAVNIDIISTPRGYILQDKNIFTATIKCKHDRNKMIEELFAIVDLGGIIKDVMISHGAYGDIKAPLDLATRYDVEEFIKITDTKDYNPLSDLTDGIHTHTINCKTEEIFLKIQDKLKQLDVLIVE